jgi:ubiquinone/menaquinone biosynthesis C-methylase UbiE
MRRVVQEEWLDSDQGSQEEISLALGDLRRVNLRWGGNALYRRLFHRVVAYRPCSSLHVLEVGAGRADALQQACRDLEESGVRTRITLLDRCAHHLPGREDWHSSLPFPELVTGDARVLPFPDKSVDVVASCLFLHHLDETEIMRFLEESLRVARVAVVVNDIERSRLHWLLARFACAHHKSAISRHDGPVSVRRAYTRSELARLLLATGHPFEICRAFFFRVGAIVCQPALAKEHLLSQLRMSRIHSLTG